MADLPVARQRCTACGTEMPAMLLTCPSCRRLVHADELKRLAAQADEATRQGDHPAAILAWRRALRLLPRETNQFQTIANRIDTLSRTAGRFAAPPPTAATPAPPAEPTATKADGQPQRSAWGAAAAGAGTLGLLLWKFKFALGFILTKGKLLLLGLTKASTFLSMILSMGVYWSLWGWKFAVGVVLSIYVHEMGHVAALRRLGIKATAPMFIPGLGAVVRLKEYPATPREDAQVGLAGPLWGLGAAAAAFAVYRIMGWASFGAIAQVGAWINLFNLLPVWQLDGSRGFSALSRSQRWLVVAAVATMWYFTEEGLLALLLLVAGLRALGGNPGQRSDRVAAVHFVFLVVTLATLSNIQVPGVDF